MCDHGIKPPVGADTSGYEAPALWPKHELLNKRRGGGGGIVCLEELTPGRYESSAWVPKKLV